jgi:hypothetical protein
MNGDVEMRLDLSRITYLQRDPLDFVTETRDSKSLQNLVTGIRWHDLETGLRSSVTQFCHAIR